MNARGSPSSATGEDLQDRRGDGGGLFDRDIVAAALDRALHSAAEAIQPLDLLLEQWSGQENADFWRREALFHDPRWVQVRACAARALARLPDEERATGPSA